MGRNFGTIAIRTTFGSSTGLGHLVRMSLLADALSEEGRYVLFLLDYENFLVFPFLKHHKTSYLYSHEQTSLDPIKDASLCMDALQDVSIDMIVLDSYQLDIEWENQIKESGYHLAVVDDLQRKHNCDIVIDQGWAGIDNTLSRYDALVPKDCIRLLGPRFAMIDPVYNTPPFPSPELPTVMFSLGGGGDFALIAPVLRELLMLIPESLNVRFLVILGPLSKNKQLICDLAEKDQRICPVDSPSCLHSFYLQSSLFVGALGTSFYETSALQLPALTFSLAPNQGNEISLLEDFGHYFHISLDEFRQTEKAARLILILLENLERIQFLRKSPVIGVDGSGTSRIAEMICGKNQRKTPLKISTSNHYKSSTLCHGVTYRPVEDWDINHVLASRNLQKNMKNMTQNTSILPVDHYSWWFANQRESYLFEKNNEKSLYIWHELVNYQGHPFLIGGWFVCDENAGFDMAAVALQWQLDMTSEKYPDAIWIAIIKKTNRYVNMLNTYMGFVEVEKGSREYEAIRLYFHNPSFEEFNYLKKISDRI